jgi:hypothetical protein
MYVLAWIDSLVYEKFQIISPKQRKSLEILGVIHAKNNSALGREKSNQLEFYTYINIYIYIYII